MDWLVFIAALVMVVAAVVAYQYCRSIKSIAATAPSFDAAPLHRIGQLRLLVLALVEGQKVAKDD
jgi:hypothetical protein